MRAETTTPVSQRNTGRACGRLLVVDDDPEVRGLLVRLLESEGYQVEEASTGAEATTVLSGRSPDLVDSLSAARSHGALTVAVTNAIDSPLAAAA